MNSATWHGQRLEPALAGDADHHGEITIDETIAAVDHALKGCAG